MKKLRVGVVYGGRSGEHEVSIASAASIFRHLDRQRYDPVPIRIEKDGRWVIAERIPTAMSAADVIEQGRLQAARTSGREAHLVAYPAEEQILAIERRDQPDETGREQDRAYVTGLSVDVVFPVLHGPFGEDGTVQGLLELANVPYVGAGVLASAVGMDKAVAKLLFTVKGLPIVDYVVMTKREWDARPQDHAEAAATRLGYPVFVKPANLGSSVGISKAFDQAQLRAAVELAAGFDRKVIIEAAVPNAREIECGVIGNDEPEASVPGEIIPSREFYDYEAKYLDEGSRLLIPAPLSPEQTEYVRRLAVEAFQAIDGAGLARIDFLIARDTGRVFVNEVNTLPGFTTISMFPKLWEASGLDYPALLDRVIHLALDRHAEKQQIRTSIS